MILRTIFATAATFIAGQALADNVASPVSRAWTGFYLGTQVGHVWADANIDHIDYPGMAGWFNLEPDGILGGVHLGYNWQTAGGFVLGLETEFNGHSGSDSGDNVDFSPGLYVADLQMKWSGSTRLRLGYGGDRWLGFVTGGVAYAGYDVDYLYNSTPAGASAADRLVGWTLGGGVEYAVTDAWRVRGSYLYADYGHDRSENYLPGGGGSLGSYDIDLKTHSFSVGASYAF